MKINQFCRFLIILVFPLLIPSTTNALGVPAPTDNPTQIISVATRLSITTTSLPSRTVGVAYTANLRATGGRTPYTWSIASGALPSGLALRTGGIISGTPIVSGTFNFTVMVRDSSSPAQNASRALAITINPSSAPCFNGQTCYSTRAEAVSRVPTHVVPKECFVWRDGPSTFPWRVIPGTGCAHWVAHQFGIRRGTTCSQGYSIRVSDVISGRTEVQIQGCKVGDIWTDSERTHCGIVRQVANGRVLVKHCSSGEGGVVQSWFSSGRCWR